MDEAETGQWLTLAEVRNRTGRNIDGLRSWAKRGARSGKLRVRKSNRGEVQVFVSPDELAELAEAVASSALGDELGADDLPQELAEARAAAASAAAEVRRLEAHLEDVRQTLTATLTAERARADRLEAALAEARRPWLARVLEGLRRKGS